MGARGNLLSFGNRLLKTRMESEAVDVRSFIALFSYIKFRKVTHMSSVQSLPIGGTWTTPENSYPELRGTAAAERLDASSGDTARTAGDNGSGNDVIFGAGTNIIVGGGGADQLVGSKAVNIFKYENATDSLSNAPDTIFNFDPRKDTIDVSDMLKKGDITAIHIQNEPPKEVGDVQIVHSDFGVSTLNMKVTPEGPLFSVRVDNVKLLPEHINFFNGD